MGSTNAVQYYISLNAFSYPGDTGLHRPLPSLYPFMLYQIASKDEQDYIDKK